MSSIIVVGSGVAGALLARQLLQSDGDYQIAIFEAGPDFQTGDHRTWLDYLMANKNPYKPFWDVPHSEGDRFGGLDARLFVKGGTTNHWGGWSLRFKPEDFELNSRTGMGADWPITYDNLATHYARAEFLLGIEGDSDDDDPPRHGQKFPFAAAPYTVNDMPIINAMKKLDIAYGHMPMARNGSKCVTTGTCRYCPVNARYSAAYDLATLQEEFGRKLDIRTESPVLEILMDGKMKARGVSFLNRKTGLRESMEGDTVVVCSGTIESTKLLLASANTKWPEGIGNDSGHLGRHLLGHPLAFVEGAQPENPKKTEEELGFVTLASRHFDTPKYQHEGKMLFARESGFGRTNLGNEILSNVPRFTINKKMASKRSFGIYASIEQFDSTDNSVRLGAVTGKFGLPGAKIKYSMDDTTNKTLRTHADNLVRVLKAAGCAEDSIKPDVGGPTGAHASCTCRMSAAESEGVVDKNLRVHGTDNLYVCSNAVFPNVTATNPTLTVAALAVRLAEHFEA